MERSVHDVVVKSLAKRFGQELAVRDVSFEVKHGEYLFLLGPSGCGKTTTLRMIGGLEVPTKGNIWIQGENMARIPAHKRKTAMVFQNFALFPHMTVKENLEFGLRARKTGKEEMVKRLRRMVDLLDLASVISKKPDHLSIGETQRVALGRALVLEPVVILLDEPLGSIELSMRQRMLIELSRLNKELGITFIHVSHDKEEGLLVADRLVIMNRGGIEQIDSPDNVYRKPATEFVAKFFQNSNIITGHIDSVLGNDAVMKTDLGEFNVSCNQQHMDVGEKVSLVVPYDLLSRDKIDGVCNRIEGTITGQLATGSLVAYRFALDNGQVLQFLEHRTLGRGRDEPSGRLALFWRPTDAILLTTKQREEKG